MSTEQSVVMTEPMVEAALPQRRTWLWVVLALAAAAAVALLAWWLLGMQGGLAVSELAEGKVLRGDLQITVVEDGEVDAKEYYEIACKVPGGSQIKTLHVKDGDRVEVGTPLFDLDTQGLEDKIRSTELQVENAQANLAAAKKDLEIRIQQNNAAEAKAKDAVALAKLDLDKYLLGEYPMQVKEAELAIQQAQRRLEIAKKDLEGSKTARAKDFVTQKEVEQDELDVADAEFNLLKARNNLNLLQIYTYPREKRNRESVHQQAVEDLTRTQEQNANEQAKVEVDVKNKQVQYDLQADELKKLKDNLANSRVVADKAGTINFNHGRDRWRREMIEEGANVREGQVVMKIPNTSKMIVNFKVAERDRYRVQIGQAAGVTVATLPGVQLYATVSSKGSRPDPNDFWANPDVKMFACEATLNDKQPVDMGTIHLSPNTTAKIRVFVDTLRDVTYVPVQAVYRVGQRALVATRAGGVPRFIDVEPGQSNEDYIQVISGVSAGQLVLLSLDDTLKKQLQQFRDEAAHQQEENGEQTPPAEPVARPADPPRPAGNGEAPAAGGEGQRPNLTEDERTQLAALMVKLRDPENQTPEKKKALLDALDPELRKKLEPIISRMGRRPPGEAGGGEAGGGAGTAGSRAERGGRRGAGGAGSSGGGRSSP